MSASKINLNKKYFTKEDIKNIIKWYEEDTVYFGRDSYYSYVDIGGSGLKIIYMKKKIIKQIEELGYNCKVHFFRDPFWFCNYEIEVFRKDGQYVWGDCFGYFIGVEEGMHSKATFEKDLEEFIEELKLHL